MAIYNLTGSGVQSITSGQSQLLVDITVFDVHRSVGRASPPNYYDLGLLRLGQQGSYRPSFPLDSTSMVIDLPNKTDVLGYSLFGSTAIRVTEVVAAGLSNPIQIKRAYQASLAASTNNAVLWTYTVPANRVFRLTHYSHGIAGAASGSGDIYLTFAGSILLFNYPAIGGATTLYTQGQVVSNPVAVAGDVIRTLGDNGTPTALAMYSTMLGVEFDASAWAPA